MLNWKDLPAAELETVPVSTTPTEVLTTTGEVHTNEEATVYVKYVDSFVNSTAPRELHRQCCHLGNFARIKDIPVSGTGGRKNKTNVAENSTEYGEPRLVAGPRGASALLTVGSRYCFLT